ncbi:serine/threonine protein kinase [Streptomyces xiamenensis]|uniref:serine/threonine protein kinase n=1 Tax=Streptomyces xiamenensis TaxID=408015 RepID=UPI003D709545
MEPLGAADPRQVGTYKLLGKLGEGSMGQVYLARSARGRTVAVKLIRNELAGHPDFRRRFQAEIEAATRVGGQWIAPVLDHDSTGEAPWVVTDYIAGPSLHTVVTSTYGPLPEHSIRHLASGLTQALRDIHGAGLIHRDLKPSNILITIDGPRVIDFGIARAVESTGGTTMTHAGAIVGSPGFMSPEQARALPVSPASDIFALGSVLTFAATGRSPFGSLDSTLHTMLLRIVQGEEDLTGVPDRLRPLIEICLSQNPAGRPTPDQIDELLATSQAPDPRAAQEHWLPASVLAGLGKDAIALLTSEDADDAHPPAATQPPSLPPAPPGPPSPVPALYGPAGPLPPTAHGYGTGAPPGFGPATAPFAPHPPVKKKTAPWVIAAAIAVPLLVIGAVVAAVALKGGDKDDQADDPTPTPTEQNPGPVEDPDEPEEPDDEPASDDVDRAYLGAWDGVLTADDGVDDQLLHRVVIEQSRTETRATSWFLTPYVLCHHVQTVATSASGDLVFSPGELTVTPEDASREDCDFGDQSLTVSGDEELTWTSSAMDLELPMIPSFEDKEMTFPEPLRYGGSYDLEAEEFEKAGGPEYPGGEPYRVSLLVTDLGDRTLSIYAPDYTCSWDASLVYADPTTVLVGPLVPTYDYDDSCAIDSRALVLRPDEDDEDDLRISSLNRDDDGFHFVAKSRY